MTNDESIKAKYSNNKSKSIDTSAWIEHNSLIKIYLVLRDENYLGSNYSLFYLPDRDLLTGKYFQAVEGVTYDRGFMKTKYNNQPAQ